MRAFKIKANCKIHVYPVPVNMCRAFNGLSDLVQTNLGNLWEKDRADSGDLFVFVNKKGNYLKILFWESHGWCIFAKRLPEATFDIDLEQTDRLNFVGMQRLVDVVVRAGKGEKLKKAA